MKKHIKKIIASMLVLSTIVGTASAARVLTPNEVDFRVSVNDNYTVFADTRYNFTDSQVDAINNGVLDGYYTLDMTAIHSNGLAETVIPMGCSGDYYTNFPNPVVDADDDDNNGYEEEVEVTVLGRLVEDKTYRFTVTFDKAASLKSGIILLNEQYSMPVEVQGDIFNTIPGTSNKVMHANWASAKSTALGTSKSVVDTAEKSVSKVILNEQINSKDELDAIVARKKVEYQNSILQMQRHSNKQPVIAVVTFNDAISMECLLNLISDSGASLVDYQAKFINTNGDWCTYISENTNEKQMVQTADQIAKMADAPHTDYEGIVCATVSFDLFSVAYDTLNMSDYVYFVDMGLNFVSENPEEEYLLSSYAWDLAQYSK